MKRDTRILEMRIGDDAPVYIPQRRFLWWWWKDYRREIGHETSVPEMFDTLSGAEEFLKAVTAPVKFKVHYRTHHPR